MHDAVAELFEKSFEVYDRLCVNEECLDYLLGILLSVVVNASVIKRQRMPHLDLYAVIRVLSFLFQSALESTRDL